MAKGMVGHLTEERWKEISERNLKEWLASLKPIEKTEDNPHGVAIGCKLDPNDKSPDAPRRYVKK